MSLSLDDDPYHARLKRRPILYGTIGVIHTLLTAGIVFGWASLLPVLRSEGVDLTPSDFARIFTHGAIGNYMSSLPFGLVLDRCGPKLCGIISSTLFAAGLISCSFLDTSSKWLDLGFTLIGFAGPAIQLPTLHLARLFSGEAKEGGGGGAAIFMSCQAAAFDGGTVVFALFAEANSIFPTVTTTAFFRLYTAVPIFTLLTALLVWPNKILPDPLSSGRKKSYVGAGSPYLSPATVLTTSPTTLRDAPLSVVLTRPPFYCLAFWVSVHILKLNFVVATLNDQLQYAYLSDPKTVDNLIRIFGAMLPFGFVALPAVAYMLSKSTIICFQVANIVSVVYGSVLAFVPDQALYQVIFVFTSVATLRQFVYSTVFHQTGELFGFKNYGVILGLTNVVVSAVSLVQGPLVEWAESKHNYFWANVTMLLMTLPLFVIVYWTVPGENEVPPPATEAKRRTKGTDVNERSSLLQLGELDERRSRRRAMSDAHAPPALYD
mmetsp:Transcript_21058/g.43015  ORF Transcript_21058/g.43015 Transcript_21058/m.43015 type:complete len:491 (-) Transcript_21058:31-1503(-)